MVLQQLSSLLLTLPFLQPIINKSKLSVCNSVVVAVAADATTFTSASAATTTSAAAFVFQPQIKLPINSICVLLLAILQFKPINSASSTTFYLSQNC